MGVPNGNAPRRAAAPVPRATGRSQLPKMCKAAFQSAWSGNPQSMPQNRDCMIRWALSMHPQRWQVWLAQASGHLDPPATLVGQTLFQLSPSTSQDAGVQTRFGLDMSFWILDCTLGRSGHALDVEILDYHSMRPVSQRL